MPGVRWYHHAIGVPSQEHKKVACPAIYSQREFLGLRLQRRDVGLLQTGRAANIVQNESLDANLLLV